MVPALARGSGGGEGGGDALLRRGAGRSCGCQSHVGGGGIGAERNGRGCWSEPSKVWLVWQPFVITCAAPLLGLIFAAGPAVCDIARELNSRPHLTSSQRLRCRGPAGRCGLEASSNELERVQIPHMHAAVQNRDHIR
eukprot:364056-Chlamydomonas_euryale.AAC.2